MSPARNAWLLVYCLIFSAESKFQVHPKFAAIKENHRRYTYFTGAGVGHGTWFPSMQTGIFSLDDQRSKTVLMDVTIEDLPKDETFEMKFKYKCHPSATEEIETMRQPFRLTREKIYFCHNKMKIYIKDLKGEWSTNTTFKISVTVNYSPDESHVLLSEALTHNMRVQLEFIGAQWKLESNALYLYTWDALHIMRSGLPRGYENEKFTRHFMTKEGADFLTNMKFDSHSGFGTLQFIDRDIANAIRNAPEFVKAMLIIGAFLLIQYDSVGTALGGPCSSWDSIPVMSTTNENIIDSDSRHYFRLDSQTGILTYSRYGMAYFSHKRSVLRNGKVKIRICRVLQSTLSRSYVRGISVEHFDLEPDVYPGVGTLPVPVDECIVHEPSPRNVTIFTRANYGGQIVYCPIICSDPMQEYLFYKDNEPLRPHGIHGWTQINGLEVHKSSSAIRFDVGTTAAHAGRYRCTAGGKEGIIHVDIVALPVFSHPQTNPVNGELPPRIHAPIGGGYSVNCTVFHFGMRSVTLWPEFYVIVDKRKPAWTKLSGKEFLERLKFFDSNGDISLSHTAISTTLTLTIRQIPKPTDVFDLSHRYVCKATVSLEDIKRFGVSDYGVESGSDVIVLSPLEPTQVESTISPCCLDGCFGRDCLLTYSLKPEVLKELESIGVGTRGTFAQDGANLSEKDKKLVKYDKRKGAVSYKISGGVKQLSTEEKKRILRFRPALGLEPPTNQHVKIFPPKNKPDNPPKNDPCGNDPFCSLLTNSGNSTSMLMKVFNVTSTLLGGNPLFSQMTAAQNASINSLFEELMADSAMTEYSSAWPLLVIAGLLTVAASRF